MNEYISLYSIAKKIHKIDGKIEFDFADESFAWNVGQIRE